MPLLPLLDFVASKSFTLRYRASVEPQLLHVTAKLPNDEYFHVSNAVPHRAIDVGCGGSDVFPPTAGACEIVKSEHKGRTVTATIRVAGVAPLFMRVFIEGLRDMAWRESLTSLSVAGDLALDDSDMSVTERQIRGWVDDPEAYPRAWPKPSFELEREEQDTKGITARVRFKKAVAAKLHGEVQTRFLAWNNLVGRYVSPMGEYVERKLGQTQPKYAWKKDEVVMRVPEFERTRGPSGDALVNMLERLHHEVAPIAEASFKL